MLTFNTQLPAQPINPFGHLMPMGAQSFEQSACEATLVLDIKGCIVDGNIAATEMLGLPSATLKGQDITAFLPGLPFSPLTPGQNLAYIGLNLAIERWKPHMALTFSGIPMALEITLHIIKRRGQCFIALGLRRPLADQKFK